MHLWLSGVVREFGIDIKTLLYLKWITNKDLLYSTSILLNVMCQLGWEGNLGIMDIGICMAGSLCCSPETFTPLLPGYTPIQSKKFFKNGSVSKETQKRGDLCICVADSLCCTVETNNTVKQLYFSKS